MGPPLRPVPDSAWVGTLAKDAVRIMASTSVVKTFNSRQTALFPPPVRSDFVNFARDLVEAAPAGKRALVVLPRTGGRYEVSFGEVGDRSARLAGTLTASRVRQADVVMTVIGKRP